MSPKFRTKIVLLRWKSLLNSATPKLRLAAPPFSSMAMAEVREAGNGCTRPDPPCRTEYPMIFEASAVLRMAVRTSAGSQPGCASSASAATPATCGVAIEVPEKATPWLPVPMAVEVMLTPGPLTSGLRWPSPVRGPPELKSAKACQDGLGMGVLEASVAVLAAASAAPSDLSTPRNGMVTFALPSAVGMSPSKMG